ncbi:MAG: BCCT family transporter [Olsenella sp.]|nr:BCCT family transporter [Olsenella sp.]
MDEEKKSSNTVFYVSLAICALICIWAVAFNENFTNASNAMFSFFTVDFAWLYEIALFAMVVFVIVIGVSRFGKIKLGPDDSKPEYSTVSWFAMLFGCGMGVGLVFWGVSEPLVHFTSENLPTGDAAGSAAAALYAMRASYLHWGISPWANYAVMGLALAYFQFRKNKPALVSTTLEPLVGKKLTLGWLGKLVDVLAVFATVAGVVTSLGLGVLQINAGFNFVFGIPNTLMVQIIFILVISVIYIGTAVAGIDKGISVISDLNLYIATGVIVVSFLVGPKVEILNNLVGGLGSYIQYFIGDSLNITAYGDNTWIQNWAIFYFAWFIAWAPFVGVFIARISKGRTISEFIAGVVLVPAVASILWFAVFGSLGLHLSAIGTYAIDQLKQIAATPETGLFVVLQHYPLGALLSVVMIVLLCTFFITSANSGTFVLGMLSSNGNLNPPKGRMLLWGVVQSVMAIGMLIAGGLKPLQTISIAAAFPFIFIQIAIMFSTVKALSADKAVADDKDEATEAAPKVEAQKA